MSQADAGGWELVEGWKIRCVETPCLLGNSMSSTEVRVKGGGYVRQVWWLGLLMLVWEGIRGELPWF